MARGGSRRSRQPGGVGATEGLRRACADADAGVRAAAARALASSKAPGAVDLLLGLLRDPKPSVRRAAAEGLPSLGPRAGEELLALCRDRSPQVRAEAARALGRLRDERGLVPLAALLGDEAGDVRQAAAEALVAVGPPGVHWLEGLLSDPSAAASILRVAAECLGRIGSPGSVEPLLVAAYAEAPEVREAAAIAVGRLPSLELAPLDRRRIDLVVAAVRGGVRLGAPPQDEQEMTEAAVRLLREAAAGSPARGAVARALAEVGTAEATRALVELLADSETRVRTVARSALAARSWRPGTAREQALWALATGVTVGDLRPDVDLVRVEAVAARGLTSGRPHVQLKMNLR